MSTRIQSRYTCQLLCWHHAEYQGLKAVGTLDSESSPRSRALGRDSKHPYPQGLCDTKYVAVEVFVNLLDGALATTFA